jgi:ankyrin repeat protein
MKEFRWVIAICVFVTVIFLIRFVPWTGQSFTNPPIHEQAASGNLAGVKALVESGVSANLRNERGWTPLFYALTWKRMDVAQYLVDHGADVNSVDNDGMTLLDQMFDFRHKDQIFWLKQHGAHPKHFTENGEVRK